MHITNNIMKEELVKYVNIALEKRLNETNFKSSYQLLGDCYYNTKCLAKILENNNINYTIYQGALIGDYTNIPDSFSEAKKIGLVHYWVKTNGYICEISSESRMHFGEPVVLKDKPDNYIVFSDSKTDYL